MSDTRFFASLRLFGPDLDPLEITQALRIPPTRTHRAGEPNLSWTRRQSVLDRGVDYAQGHWSLCSREHVQGDRATPHIAWLLVQFPNQFFQ